MRNHDDHYEALKGKNGSCIYVVVEVFLFFFSATKSHMRHKENRIATKNKGYGKM